ncbi:MAG: alkaline phosphatase family protein [Bdellovibrionales bacterium]|nr:alkaline phosphatase family protein [Bdellovibrionales bacterium]
MIKISKTFLACALLCGFGFRGEVFASTPYRLGVVLVVDQFRADYLMRFRERLKAAGPSSGGFRLLMEKGAYFPLADHGLLQNMTGPGHATILSGSYPYRNLISQNNWYDREMKRDQYCVQDDAYKVIGSDGVVTQARSGISPKNFNATTIGDELKNVNRASRVVSVALKDRASVLLGGKRPDLALWFHDKTCQWVSSEYYLKKLPAFALKRNELLLAEKDKTLDFGTLKDIKRCSKQALQTPWGVKETFNAAIAAVDEFKLGRGKDVDLLLVSLSSHDYLGHHFGPNHPNLEEMTIAEDRLLSEFFAALSSRIPGGMRDVFVVLTGDHGIPPARIPDEYVLGERIPENELPELVEKTMTEAFGKPKGGRWVDAIPEFQLYLNQDAMKSAGITPIDALRPLRAALLRQRYVDQVWARDEILFDRKIPAGEYGIVADRTLSTRSGDILIALKPFFQSDAYPLTHMTMYSYDRYVPLAFYGKTFRPGVYRQIVNIVDIAPTLTQILGVIPPAQSEGRVLTEILR